MTGIYISSPCSRHINKGRTLSRPGQESGLAGRGVVRCVFCDGYRWWIVEVVV